MQWNLQGRAPRKSIEQRLKNGKNGGNGNGSHTRTLC